GHEKQNDSTLRVIKCPYWYLGTKELISLSFPQRKLLSAFPLPASLSRIKRGQRQWKNYYSLRPLLAL
ncbi:MAG: hypothetical protein OET57_12335, partial [Desulfobacteraceae bacterium]|nr:hypothetical protein [Desulfobacteraceae bacterium]